MKTHELLEAATLDALGLLDDNERAAFEAAFTAAPPALQAQIRREQSRLCTIEGILPVVQPDPALRARVVASVSAAAREAAAELAAASTARPAPFDAAPIPPIMGTRRVSPLWRGAALGFATAAVVMAVATLQLHGRFSELQRQARSDALITEILKTYSSRVLEDSLFDQRTTRVVLTASDPAQQGKASVWLNPEWDHAQFYCLNLPARDGRTYRVVVLDDQNRVVNTLAEFNSNGGLMNRELPAQQVAAGTDGRIGVVMFDERRPDAPEIILSEQPEGRSL